MERFGFRVWASVSSVYGKECDRSLTVRHLWEEEGGMVRKLLHSFHLEGTIQEYLKEYI